MHFRLNIVFNICVPYRILKSVGGRSC